MVVASHDRFSARKIVGGEGEGGVDRGGADSRRMMRKVEGGGGKGEKRYWKWIEIYCAPEAALGNDRRVESNRECDIENFQNT